MARLLRNVLGRIFILDCRNKKMNKSRLILIFIILSTTCLVQANEKDKRYLLTKQTYDLLNVVRAEMEENNYHTAIQKLTVYLDEENIKA